MKIEVLIHRPTGELVSAREPKQPILSKVQLEHPAQDYLDRHKRELDRLERALDSGVAYHSLDLEDHKEIILNYYRRLINTGSRERSGLHWNGSYWRAACFDRRGRYKRWYCGAHTSGKWKVD